MTNDQPIDPLARGLRSVPADKAASQPSPNRSQEADPTRPSFQVLLERLQASADALQQESASVGKPDELAGAVDRARESLEDALELKDELLEAWRQASRQSPESGASS